MKRSPTRTQEEPAKPKMPSTKKDASHDQAKPPPSEPGDGQKAPKAAAAKKKPAASMKRPAASPSTTLPTKVNKYWYKKDGKIGLKADQREVMTVQALESNNPSLHEDSIPSDVGSEVKRMAGVPPEKQVEVAAQPSAALHLFAKVLHFLWCFLN